MQSRNSHNKRDQNHSDYKSADQVNVIKYSFVNTTGRFDLQLNPWNNLEQQSVANAIVLASSALPSLYPIVNAIMTIVQIDNPSSPILIKSLSSKWIHLSVVVFLSSHFSNVVPIQEQLPEDCLSAD